MLLGIDMNRRTFLLATVGTIPSIALGYPADTFSPQLWQDLNGGNTTFVLNYRASWSLTCQIKAELISEALADNPAVERLIIDGSIIRVHQHVASKKTGIRQFQGKSRGGLSTKIHAAVDALGNRVRLILTPGQASESKQAQALIAGFEADVLIADKGYDADNILLEIEAVGSKRLAVTFSAMLYIVACVIWIVY